MSRQSQGHYAAAVPYSVDGVASPASGALFAPQNPTRRRSPDLSAYDRLDPPKPRRYGRIRVEGHTDGMDRLRAALDRMEAQVNAKLQEALRVTAEDAMRRAGYHSGGTVKADPVAPADLDRGEFIIGAAKAKAEPGQSYSMCGVEIVVDEAVGPDRAVMGYRWPDGSIRPYAHKRSDTFW